MSPFSGPVLGGAAVLSAPALWSSLVLGTTPVEEGLLRYIGAVVVLWIGLSTLVALVGPAPREATTTTMPRTEAGGTPASQPGHH
jgi:threonine/homoserine/homoserine lactone efflux protein